MGLPRESQPFKFGCSATALRAARIGSAWRGMAWLGLCRQRAPGRFFWTFSLLPASINPFFSVNRSVSLRHHCGATCMQPCAMQHNTPQIAAHAPPGAISAARTCRRRGAGARRMRYIARRCNTRGATLQHARRDVAGDCATRACLPVHSVAKLYLPLMLSMLEIVRRMIWAVFR